jgi:two-component system nitrate/nitrite response regulator NarL
MAYNPQLGGDQSGLPVRVFIWGEDALAADGLRVALRGDSRIACVPSVEAAEVVLWDMGGSSARSFAPAPLAAARQPRPLVVALVHDEASAVYALQQGARGVVQRSSHAAMLAAAIVAVRLGLCVLDAEIADHYLVLPRTAAGSDEPDALTQREHEVLELLALGLSNKAIAERLTVSVHTVKFHVNSILAKLGTDSRTGAVATALRRGLVTT